MSRSRSRRRRQDDVDTKRNKWTDPAVIISLASVIVTLFGSVVSPLLHDMMQTRPQNAEPPITQPAKPPITQPAKPPITQPAKPPITQPAKPPITQPANKYFFKIPSYFLVPFAKLWKIVFTPPSLYIIIIVIVAATCFFGILDYKDLGEFDLATKIARPGAIVIVTGIVGVIMINMYSLDNLTTPYFLVVFPFGAVDLFNSLFTPPILYIFITLSSAFVIPLAVGRMMRGYW